MSDPKNPKDGSFRKAFYHLKISEEYFADHAREVPMSIGADVARKYGGKIQWMFTDFYGNHKFPIEQRVAFVKEIQTEDIMFGEPISRKCLALSPKQREVLEQMLDCLIAGEQVTFILNDSTDDQAEAVSN